MPLIIVKKRWKWIVSIVVAGFALLQLTNLPRTNPPVEPGRDVFATNPPPPEIRATIHNACYDCHSNETKWPWYSHVAPTSRWLVNHVNDARDHLNFSDWPHDNPQRAAKRWRHIAEAVRDGEMPWRSYTWIHGPARLTEAQRKQLVDWAQQQAEKLNPEAAD